MYCKADDCVFYERLTRAFGESKTISNILVIDYAQNAITDDCQKLNRELD